MSLLNAPAYDARKEKRKRDVMIGALAAVVLAIVIGLGGYFMGHGWFFSDLPAEHRVSVFMTALEHKDYNRAYGIWFNDPNWQQHPERHASYPVKRFTEDWTTASDYGPITSYHVDISRRTGSGIIIALHVNGNPKPMFLWYERSDGTLSYSPLELTY